MAGGLIHLIRLHVKKRDGVHVGQKKIGGAQRSQGTLLPTLPTTYSHELRVCCVYKMISSQLFLWLYENYPVCLACHSAGRHDNRGLIQREGLQPTGLVGYT